MHSTHRAYPWLAMGLVMAVSAAIIISTGLGFIRISPSEVVRVIAAKLTGDATLASGLDPVFSYVVFDVRLPRILAAVGVGAGLAICGVLFQGLLLNPLADPYTLGISSGAAFGASVALLASTTLLGHLPVPLFAFAGAMAALVVVLLLASHDGQLSANTLILSGVIVSAILAAGISFMKYLADEHVGIIVFWLMGSLAGRTWPQVGVVFATVLAGFAVAVYYGRDLNIIALGSRTSDSLGVETGRVRKILLVAGSLLVGVCVSVSGIIGFIGLIVPHLMRMVAGPDNRRLVVLSALAGALLLLAADTVTRAVLPTEVPIGVLTALIGGPFFCYIFRRRGAFHG